MSIACASCGADAIPFAVPAGLGEWAPDGGSHARVCRVCLTVDTAADADDGVTLSALSDALPDDPEAAAGVVLLVGLLESLALNRREIQAVVDHLEADGVDVLLALDRLGKDPDLRPAVDLGRRSHQLQQLLE